MPYFDRFDICEAYAALEHDYSEGGTLRTRGIRGTAWHQVSVQLDRIGFRGSWFTGDADHLTENSLAIYDAYVIKHNLPLN